MKAVLFGSIALLLLVLLVIVLVVMINITNNIPTPQPNIIGGCSGTRWGCCPDGMTPRYDPDAKL